MSANVTETDHAEFPETDAPEGSSPTVEERYRIVEGGAAEAPHGTHTGHVPAEVEDWERPSVLATVKGLVVTTVNFMKNLFPQNRWQKPTILYPEERRSYSPRFRGIHQLTKRPDGSLKCVACFMCATICPAECIVIEAGEFPDKRVEKYPVRFDIDMLRCVMCGLCVDACPEEAIIMTSDYEMAAFSRQETVYPISLLAERPQLASTPPGYRPRYEPGPDLVR
jgi:NADH-quinone oxidoreductase subunit I